MSICFYPRVRNKGQSLIDIPLDFTVIDIETTGYDPKYDEIIEIAALKVRNGIVEDTFNSLVKPRGYYYGEGFNNFKYIDEFTTELTGITNEMLDAAPEIKDVLPKFVDFIQDDVLFGHYVHFDINFLYDKLEEYLGCTLSNDCIDFLRLARKIYPHFENHKLDTIARNLNICNEDAHRSLADCRIVLECFDKLKAHINENNIDIKSLFKKKSKYSQYQNLSKDIVPTDYNFDEDHMLFNKYCTFTGKLEKIERKDAAQIVVNIGGHCLNSVTKQTNFLILGNLEYSSNVKGGKSNKLKKAEKLILEGQDLQILSENVFYELIENQVDINLCES